MEAILQSISTETTKTIFMLHGEVTKYERRAILLEICKLGPTATVDLKDFRCKHDMKVTPSVMAATYLLVDKTLHDRDVMKLDAGKLKELVHGDAFDVKYGQLTPKKLIFICDCQLPGQFFANDRALAARMKFIYVLELTPLQEQ